MPRIQRVFLRYPPKGSRYSSHSYFHQLVGADQDVLDCGCGEGYSAAELLKERNRLVGIDIRPAPKAGEVFEAYIQCDLSAGLGQAVQSLGERWFSGVLPMDI